MTALILLTLLTAPAGDFPDLIVPPARIGLVPTLSVPPADLPLSVDHDGGTWLPGLRANYTAAQVSALYRYPRLAQDALDLAVKAERARCDIIVMDMTAAVPTWYDRLKSGAAWTAAGVVVGVVSAAYLLRR